MSTQCVHTDVRAYRQGLTDVIKRCTMKRMFDVFDLEVGKCVANLVHQLEVSDVEHIVPESVGLVSGWYADTI